MVVSRVNSERGDWEMPLSVETLAFKYTVISIPTWMVAHTDNAMLNNISG